MRKDKAAGFTIVELLIVLGILLILAGFLLPAILNAKHTAQQTNCISNLRQIKTGWIAYATQYRGYLVPFRYSDSDDADWWQRVGPYVTKEPGKAIADGNGHDYNIGYISGIFVCPVDGATHQNGSATGIDYGSNYYNRKFGANDRGSYVYHEEIRHDKDGYPRRLRDLPAGKLSQIPIFTEGKVGDKVCGFNEDAWESGNDCEFPNYHPDEMVSLFFAEGSGKSMKRSDAHDWLVKYGDLTP